MCYLVLKDIICVILPAKMLLKINIVLAFIRILSIPDEEYFSETAVGCTATYFTKFYDVPVGFVPLWLLLDIW